MAKVSSTVILRERRPEDDVAIVAIRNDASPLYPPTTLERYRFQLDPALRPPDGVNLRVVAVEGEHVIGLYFFGANWNFERPATFIGSLGVQQDHRNQGIGSQLYNDLLSRARRLEAQRIYAFISADDNDSMEFARHRDFKPTGRANRMSVLDVPKANLEGYEGVREKLEADGIFIRTVAEVGIDDEDFVHRLHDMEHRAAQDIPSSESWAQTPFDAWKKWLLECPGHSPEYFWVALDGDQPVGLAALDIQSVDSAFNGLTATAKEYRGRGIARALKLQQIEWCRERGVSRIFTGNDVDNQRMLAINIRLGYTPIPDEVELALDLATPSGN